MIPELELYNILLKVTAYIVDDLENAATDEESLLYRILGEDVEGSESYFTIAKEFFSRQEHPKKLKIFKNFTFNKEQIPNISLQIPSHSSDGNVNTLSTGEADNYIELDDGSTVGVASRNFISSINLVITTNNDTEQSILFRVYMGLMVMVLSVLEVKGFKKASLSGREVQINQELMPSGVFSRVITLTFTETISAPLIKEILPLKDILFSGTAKITL